ncbi:MAG: CPP1-like family protein [Kastovskya adunca ATA6-11-RM4]|jgi:F0F1-type ATP synthase membrane subunit c/vacuolar-type H+-ATPase subunit K|nr:CPP1-like family protein [Kastovskya adunca ATA6-11-RM4]
MSDQNHYEKLGVTEDASFDEIQDARKRLMQQHRDDQKLMESVEAAYDAIIMERLRMRQEGKIKVPERIRFPERLSQTPPSVPQTAANQSPAWLRRFVDTPSLEDILWSAGAFLLLSALAIFYPAPDEAILPLAIALGFGFNIYFLNRKERQFGRALLLTLAGLVVGIGIGSVLGGALQTQLTNFNLTVETFASLVTFVILWLISSFLR